MTTRNKYILAAAPLIILGGILYFFSDIVTYVIIAWVLSMIGAPTVRFLRKYMGKNAAAGITLAGMVISFILLVWIFIPPLLTQARNLATVDYNKIVNSLEEPINDWENWLSKRGLLQPISEDQDQLNKETIDKSADRFRVFTLDSLLAQNGILVDSANHNIQIVIQVNEDNEGLMDNKDPESEKKHKSFFDTAKSNIYSFFNPSLIPQLLSSLIGTLSSFLIGFMSVIFIAFFFLREHGLFDKIIGAALPSKHEDNAHNAIDQSTNLLIRYFIGVISQITVITLFVSIFLKILGVKNALLIGFFAGLMNVIPYIGPIIGASFGVMITVSSNLDLPFYSEMLPLIFKVLAVFGIMQLLDNFIVQPNIFSKSVKAHPLEIFLVVLIGAKLGGIGGMVLAIPGYTVLRVLAKVFFSEFRVVQQITKNL